MLEFSLFLSNTGIDEVDWTYSTSRSTASNSFSISLLYCCMLSNIFLAFFVFYVFGLLLSEEDILFNRQTDKDISATVDHGKHKSRVESIQT